MAPKKRSRPASLLEVLEYPDSSLAKELVRKWSWGLMSATEVQMLSSRALADQEAMLTSIGVDRSFASKSLQMLGRLGSHGVHEGNIRRDLISALGDPAVPEPSLVKCQMNIMKPAAGEGSSQEVDVAMFLPHEVFAYLYKEERAAFEQRFLGDGQDALFSFWGELEKRGDPRLINHPMKAKANWQMRSIPTSWHGDGVPTIAGGKAIAKTFEVYSWAGILSRGSSLKTKLYTFGYMADNCQGLESMQPLWKRLMWSFAAAAEGKWPTHDENRVPYPARSLEGRRGGEDLAGGVLPDHVHLQAGPGPFGSGVQAG